MQVKFNDDNTVTMSREDFLKHFSTTQETQTQPIIPKATYNLEAEVTDILSRIGMPRNIKGFDFIREALALSVNDSNCVQAITRHIYPVIARNHKTTASRVERAIRHAIEVAWNRGDVDANNSMFGNTICVYKGKPTNSEFIATVADIIRMDMKREA
jgi:two-component system response regulator (stage 0 sporulation protein A)